jgi:hypothetical protein
MVSHVWAHRARRGARFYVAGDLMLGPLSVVVAFGIYAAFVVGALAGPLFLPVPVAVFLIGLAWAGLAAAWYAGARRILRWACS